MTTAQFPERYPQDADLIRKLLKLYGVRVQSIEKVIQYHFANLETWRQFEDITLGLIDEGFTFWGAKAIFEVIRFQRRKKIGTDGFKISNSYTAYYPRIFIAKYPQHANFFKLKRVRGFRDIRAEDTDGNTETKQYTLEDVIAAQ